MEWNELVPQWITAIGTVGAVVVALFQKLIRDWINRPKIKITCKDDNQCKVVLNSNAESSDDSNEVRIRVRLENNGNNIANHAALYVDSYYKYREKEGSYVKEDFPPKQIKDYRNTKPTLIVPQLQYYFEVATIHQYDSMTRQEDGNKAKQFYKLYLLGDGEVQPLGKGTFVIPLKFYSSRIDVYITYLKIFWDSDDFIMDKNNFGLEILSEKEFKKLKKVE